MRVSPDALRFPYKRVLLARTKLAYVHLRNLLTDAKRDRGARVFGYVVVWLPEELLLLYLQEGEVVAATTSMDGFAYRDIPIREAIALVPKEAEYGEICFHVADDEQLACMHAAQTLTPDPLPSDVRSDNAGSVLGHLSSITYDGIVEVNSGGSLNYLVLRHGTPRRAFLAEALGDRSLDAAIHDLWANRASGAIVRRWLVPPPLPNQAAPALIDAYRALLHGLVARLGQLGVVNAETLVENARRALVPAHPALAHLELDPADAADPVTTAPLLAQGVATWVNDVLWAVALPEGMSAETVLRELTRERRHLFQSAGFFDALAWKLA